MPVPEHLKAVKGDECQCGRRASTRHCPVCGSARLYGYSQPQWHKNLRGEMEQVQLFRCIGCAHKFTDAEREFCEAPCIGTKLAAQRLKAVQEAKKTGEHLTPAEKKIAEAIDVLKPEAPIELSEVNLKQMWWDLRRECAAIRAQQKIDKKEVITEFEFISNFIVQTSLSEGQKMQILLWQKEEDRKNAEHSEQSSSERPGSHSDVRVDG
jgi:hypothetical protein